MRAGFRKMRGCMLYREITLTNTAKLNDDLFDRFVALRRDGAVRETHHFAGRFENSYVERAAIPSLERIEARVLCVAADMLQQAATDLRTGFWFNAMGPGHVTRPHHHDENDELLSAVYYIRVPADSGDLLLHAGRDTARIVPVPGKLVLFAPALVHEVTENRSSDMRLSVAFNVGRRDGVYPSVGA